MEQKSSKTQKRGQRQNRQKRGQRQNRPATARTGLTAKESLRFRTPLFPTKFRKRLTYAECALSVTGTTGLAGNYFFAANGMFDPNVTGTGHQPMGFDQMMLMYNHYTVLSSKITVVANNNSAGNVYADVAVYLSPDTTSITDPSRLMENGYFVWKPLYPVGVQGAITTLSLDCNVASYFARDSNKRELLEDTELYGTVAANPTDLVYFVICAFDGASGANSATVIFRVEIEYEAIFWEPKKLTQS